MRTLVVLAGSAALVGAAAPAYADPVGTSGADASFTYRDPAAAVGVGKRACELMDQGSPQVDVIKSVSSSNPGFTVDGAAQFTMIAASAYCPQHLGQRVNQAPPAQPAPVVDLPPLAPGAA
jgi:hypothetical protein